ncbi:MAG: sigma-54 interaction domain-containing protein [Aureliella sp.]
MRQDDACGATAFATGCGELGMIGRSQPMLRIFDQIRRAARSGSCVVISGESGTGKELVASALHKLSDRSAGPFVDVNIAAVPENLIESELFGHVKGAFTSAMADRMGCFEAAHGGTLFIDEIGELQLHSQAKLLRTLETLRVRRVGACEDRQVDTRVIAATNRRLEEMVLDGKFRQDLYFRLNVMTIYLPPLRERSADIPLLVDHLLAMLCQRMRRAVPEVDRRLLSYLEQHDWPGNVRQLKNCLESMLVMSPASRLTMEDLPPRLFLIQRRGKQAQIPVGMTLEKIERAAIEGALIHFNGDRRRAARSLGVSVRTLQRKLRLWAAAPAGVPASRAERDPADCLG